ncbi:AzlC family ABC transporter permease [Vallicoccus soli]|uniref:AzlC family ABC transporter permease n=1 Tax=Vallicoccus soli TaxID=2339232 RepID=UPI001C499CCF|nr:AzlC family ABC transporter permease [Vallicoccus soli]
MSWQERRRATVRQAAGVGLATGSYGVSFGALAVAAGLSPAQACALSLLAFTGGSQFAYVGVVAGGGASASGALSALLLGSRNALYGLRVAPLLRRGPGPRGLRRAVGAQLVIDESTAVALGQPDERAARLGFWATGLAVYALWNASTLLGALAGDLLGDPRTYGLDAAAPAAFVALLAPRLRGREAWAVAAVAAVLAVALVPAVPVGVPVLAAGAVALVAALRGARAAA